MNFLILSTQVIPVNVKGETVDLLKYVWTIPIIVGFSTFILTLFVNSKKDSKEFRTKHRAFITKSTTVRINPYRLPKTGAEEVIIITNNKTRVMIAKNQRKEKIYCLKLKNALETKIVNIMIKAKVVDFSDNDNIKIHTEEIFQLNIWDFNKEIIIPLTTISDDVERDFYMVDFEIRYETLAEEEFINRTIIKKVRNKPQLKIISLKQIYKFYYIPIPIYLNKGVLDLEKLNRSRSRILKRDSE